jgi:hypothetical protein
MAVYTGKDVTVTTNLGGTHAPIAAVEAITLPETSQDYEEYHLLDDDADTPKKVPTSVKIGALRVRVIYDPTLHAALDAAAGANKNPGTTFEVKVGAPISLTYKCVGVTAGDVSLERKGIVKREYQFEVQSYEAST